ncbi:MAG: NAD-dependent malic enzyme [Planctomycetes bacterium]|nr:NAD-dependent malic enzyme [Planctomycetota bacterium]
MPDETKSAGQGEPTESIVPEIYAHCIVRTLVLRIDDQPGRLGAVASQIGRDGGLVGDVTRDWLDLSHVYRRITVYVNDEEHLEKIIANIRAIGGAEVLDVVDEVLQIHEGGKIEIHPRVGLGSMEDLQKVYTPGVAGVCDRIKHKPRLARKYTWLANTVAIITNGTAVLGLGDIGPLAGLPVMEGKSLILKELSGVNCVPILLDSRDAGEFIATVERIYGGFGAIMLEDIAAPMCFEVEAELDRRLPVPVFHDDQHGTAIVVLAGLINALRQVGKSPADVSIAVSGAGAAGTAITRMLLDYGIKDIVVLDRSGAIYPGRKGNTSRKEELARITNPGGVSGSLDDVVAGRDCFIGVSSPGILSRDAVSKMKPGAIVLALANPLPEITLTDALEAGAEVAMDGRSMNNALAFPGIMRGTLDSGASSITSRMKLAAAMTIAESAEAGRLLPNLLDQAVHRRVADAVAAAAG